MTFMLNGQFATFVSNGQLATAIEHGQTRHWPTVLWVYSSGVHIRMQVRIRASNTVGMLEVAVGHLRSIL